MARFLLLAADHTAGAPGAATLVLVVLVVLVVAAVVVSLCTSSTHEKLWGQQRGSSSSAPLAKADSSVGASNRKRLLSATLSGIGGKAARMVSWNRRSPSAPDGSSDDEEEAVAALGPDDDDAVWRKAIIMGDKCRPLQFSGHIAFDSDGNQLPSPPAAAVKRADPDVHAENN